MKSAESSQKGGLLGGGGEGKTLDGLGSVAGSSANHLGRVSEAGGSRLVNSVGLVVGLVCNSESEFSSEALLGGGLSLGGSEADGVLLGETLSGGVVEVGEVHGVGGEALVSALGTLGLLLEATVILGQCP